MEKINKLCLFFMVSLTLLASNSCKPDDKDLIPAQYPSIAEVFIDNFSPGLDYAAFGESDLTAFDVVNDETYNDSEAAMKFSIPAAGSPDGGYAGGVFLVPGRNLTAFNTLTFYAKASQTAIIDAIGFGNDFAEGKHLVTQSGLQIDNKWRKYFIPIPAAAKLTNEKGMFVFADGPDNGAGYTVWIDEVKFEKLDVWAYPQATIMGDQNVSKTGFVGIDTDIENISYKVNMPNGINQNFNIGSGYFDLISSNEAIAKPKEDGGLEVLSTGTVLITAEIDGIAATGSLTLNVAGEYAFAPTPTIPAANVISIFSDAYNNVPVDYYNGYFTPDGQTTQGQNDITINGDNIIFYTQLNFVGIGTFLNVTTVNASAMTHLHVDLNVQENINPGDFITIQLLNDVGGNETSGSVTLSASELVQNDWASFDIPLSSFTGLTDRSKLGLIFFISNATISDVFVDNIFYYN